MTLPPPASIPSRRAAWLGWLVLLVGLVFGPSQARASFTRPALQMREVIALSFTPQLPQEPRFKLEIGSGIICGNDPVNRHDPLGLAELGSWEYDPVSGVLGFVSDYNRYYFGKDATLNGQALSPLFAQPIDQPSVALGGRSMTMAFGSEGARALYGGAELFAGAAIGMTPLGPYMAARGATQRWLEFGEMEPGAMRTLTGLQAGTESLGALLYVLGPMAAAKGPLVASRPLALSPIEAVPGILASRATPLLNSRFSANILAYTRAVEVHTGFRIYPLQRARLVETLRGNAFSRLTPEAGRLHRRGFTQRVRAEQIAEWERQTGQIWPKYTQDLLNPEGRVLRHAGDPFDAHHVIENIFGGPHEWWNLTPARFPDAHQGGLHLESIMQTLFP